MAVLTMRFAGLEYRCEFSESGLKHKRNAGGGPKVLFDFDLAEMYCVEVKVLKQAVRRNLSGFPKDFMFELTDKEWLNIKQSDLYKGKISLRSQIVTLESGIKGQHSKYKPFAFTDQLLKTGLPWALRFPKMIEVGPGSLNH